MSEVQTVRGGAGTPGPGPAFVDVVTGDGVAQSVPAEWVGNPIFDKGFTLVDPPADDAKPASTAPAGNPEVQLVAGTDLDGSLIPAIRDADQEHIAAVEEATAAEPPTEKSTHAEIDAYAEAHDIDLGEAANGTKADKVAVIEAAPSTDTTTTDGEAPSDNDPHSGEEN